MKSAAKWVLGLIVAICMVGVGVMAGPLLATMSNPIDSKSETSNTQVIQAVTRIEQVALLSLGIHGLGRKTGNTTVLGIDIPGSERALFLEYSFNAKLGIDSQDVDIEWTGGKSYKVSLPEFSLIGFGDVKFRLPIESNGVLSWVTPQINDTEMINQILSVEAQQKYIDSNEEILIEQAKAFYGGIITGIDPDIELEFEFGSSE